MGEVPPDHIAAGFGTSHPHFLEGGPQVGPVQPVEEELDGRVNMGFDGGFVGEPGTPMVHITHTQNEFGSGFGFKREDGLFHGGFPEAAVDDLAVLLDAPSSSQSMASSRSS